MTDNLAWRFLSAKHVDELSEIHEPEACRAFFHEIFVFPSQTPQASIDLLVDLYMFLYAFCKDRDLTPLKTSVALAIMHRVVQRDLFLQSADHGKESPWTLTDSFKHFQVLLLRHSVERPPISTGIFDAKDVAQVVDYVTHSYYRHFNLYQSIFIPQAQVLIVQTTCMDISKPRIMPPLQQAITMQRKSISPPDEVAEPVSEA
ncbi:hypothetical protein AC1031_016214 [Aphanomyces cochlioides]|nr:hypothetical protein AC1031_016214 [Aphanomyces cochlioides]